LPINFIGKKRRNFKKKNKPTSYKNNVVTYGSGKTIRYFEYDTNISTGLNTVNLETILNNNDDFFLMSKIYTYAKLEAVILTIPPIESNGQIYSNIYWENVSNLTEPEFKKSDNVRITNLHSFRYRWRYFRPINTIINYNSKAYNLRDFIQSSQLYAGNYSKIPGKVVMCGTDTPVRLALKFSFRNANYAKLAVELKNKEKENLAITKAENFTFKSKEIKKKVNEMIGPSKEVQTEKYDQLLLLPKELQAVQKDSQLSKYVILYNKYIELLTSQLDATSDYLMVEMKDIKPENTFVFDYIYKKDKNWIDHIASVQAKLGLHLAAVESKYTDKATEQTGMMFAYLKKLKLIKLKMPIIKEEDKKVGEIEFDSYDRYVYEQVEEEEEQDDEK